MKYFYDFSYKSIHGPVFTRGYSTVYTFLDRKGAIIEATCFWN